MTNTTLEAEIRHLKYVIGLVEALWGEATKSQAQTKAKLQSIPNLIWEELHTAGAKLSDTAQAIVQMQEASSVYARRRQEVQKLSLMLERPYFGRIDFQEQGISHSEQIYIGVGSLFDPNTREPLVYDWRAPISSIFYDYGLGAAQYECMDGVIQGEVLLKRQFKIDHGKLLFMFDTSLKIDDEILQQVLSQNVDDKMRAIITTIQREQNKAIRYELRPILIVEGPAGSGKTSVALHRIAYLLFAHRESMRASNVVIFSPNRIFSEYISGVLPELGEENAIQTTFQDFAESFLEYNYEVESLTELVESFLTETRQVKPNWKTSEECLKVLERYVDSLYEAGLQFQNITFYEEELISSEEMSELFQNSYTFLPLAKRLAKIRRLLLFRLKPVKKRRTIEALHRLQQDIEKMENPDFSDWDVKRMAIAEVRSEVERVMGALDQWLQVDFTKAYGTLLEQVGPEEKGKDLVEYILSQKRVPFEDVGPLLYLKGCLEGFPKQPEIGHIVIDEAQDYTPVQLAIFRKLFPSSKFTFLGDTNQALNPQMEKGAGLKSIQTRWADSIGRVALTGSYRSTKEITMFCQALLGEDKNTIETAVRRGEKPTILHDEDMTQAAVRKIEQWKQCGYTSVAIVCRSMAQTEEVYEKLKGSMKLAKVVQATDKFATGVLVLPIALAKGLEFDAVLIWDATAPNYGQPWHKHILYIACTRALHALHLLYAGELSPFLENIPGEMYEYET